MRLDILIPVVLYHLLEVLDREELSLRNKAELENVMCECGCRERGGEEVFLEDTILGTQEKNQ